MKTDEWVEAPALSYARWGHSSCFLRSSLYVYGGFDNSPPIERLSNISASQDNLSESWETIPIDFGAVFALMVPQIHSENFLILATN